MRETWRFWWWWGLAVVLAASPLAAVQTTPVVNLGSEGLALVLRLRIQPGATPQSPVDVSTAGVSTVEVGSGEYLFTGLPDASGSDRYTLQVATATEPTRALMTYSWGALPGTTVIWRGEVTAVSGTTLVEDDTAGSVQTVVASGLPSTISGATAVFRLANARTGTVVISAGSVTISNIGQDLSTGSWGCTLTAPATVADPGVYDAEYLVTLLGGATTTLPKERPWRITVRKRL